MEDNCFSEEFSFSLKSNFCSDQNFPKFEFNEVQFMLKLESVFI
jgi:hypothetical protein